MHGFGEGTSTAATITVGSSVVLHIFSLTGFTVNINVIQNNIAAACIVRVLNINIPGSAATICIVLSTGAEGPGFNGGATNIQIDNFSSTRTPRANHNVAATGTTGGA